MRAGFAFCNHLGDTVAMKYFIRRLVAPIRKLAGFIRHQHHEVRDEVRKYPYEKRQQILCQQAAASKNIVVPFKLIYSPAAANIGVAKALRRYMHVLGQDICSKLKIVQCFQTAPNLFANGFVTLGNVCRGAMHQVVSNSCEF